MLVVLGFTMIVAGEEFMRNNLLKFLMSVEAFFGNFYVTVSRGLFIPMLAYSGYDLSSTSYIILAVALASIISSLTIYRYADFMGKRVKTYLLTFHLIERVLFALLPLSLGSPLVMVVAYGTALISSMFVNILITVALMAVFVDREFVEVNVVRSAVGAAAAMLGSIYSTVVVTALDPPTSYYIAYLTASLVGFIATASTIPYRIPKEVRLGSFSIISYEVEVRRVNTFLMLTLMMGGGNLVGLAWPQLLKVNGYPISLVILLNVASSVGGVIGPYLWRGYRMYVTAVLINTLFTATIPFLTYPTFHVVTSAVLSATFVGVNLIASAIYARYAESVGVIKASILLTSANSIGQLIASLIGIIGLEFYQVFILATSLKLMALVVALFGIPETAIVPTGTAFNYGRLIYSVSMFGYSFTIEASRIVLLTILRIVVTALLLTLLIFMYRVLEIISVGMLVR